MRIDTAEQFKDAVATLHTNPNYRKPLAFGICHVQTGSRDENKILTCSFPVINWGENYGSAAVMMDATGLLKDTRLHEGPELITKITPAQVGVMADYFKPLRHEAHGDKHRNIQLVEALTMPARGYLDGFRLVFIFDDIAKQSVPAAYLKLGAISAGRVSPKAVNIDGITGALETLAWGDKAYELDNLRSGVEFKTMSDARHVDYVGKLPRYMDRVIPPSGVSIVDRDSVSYGVYLGPDTTVHAGAHVTLGAATGKNCVLGINSVTSIILGNGCMVDAGVVIEPDTQVYIPANDIRVINTMNDKKLKTRGLSGTHMKGADLEAVNGLHIRRDTNTGKITACRSKLAIG